MTEAPFTHVFPVLIEINRHAASSDGGLFVVGINNQALIDGPRLALIRGLPKRHGARTAPIDHESEPATISEAQRRRDLSGDRRRADRLRLQSGGSDPGAADVNREIAFFNQIMRPEEADKFTLILSRTEALVPVIDVMLWVARDEGGRFKRSTPIMRQG